MEFFISGEFKSIQIPIRREEGEVSPKHVNDRARVSGGGRSKSERGEGK